MTHVRMSHANYNKLKSTYPDMSLDEIINNIVCVVYKDTNDDVSVVTMRVALTDEDRQRNTWVNITHPQYLADVEYYGSKHKLVSLSKMIKGYLQNYPLPVFSRLCQKCGKPIGHTIPNTKFCRECLLEQLK